MILFYFTTIKAIHFHFLGLHQVFNLHAQHNAHHMLHLISKQRPTGARSEAKQPEHQHGTPRARSLFCFLVFCPLQVSTRETLKVTLYAVMGAGIQFPRAKFPGFFFLAIFFSHIRKQVFFG